MSEDQDRQSRVLDDVALHLLSICVCLADGPLRIQEEDKLLTHFRYSSGERLTPNELLAMLDSLLAMAKDLEDRQLQDFAERCVKRYASDKVAILEGLVKYAVCDAPIGKAESRFIAAAASWIRLDLRGAMEWSRVVDQSFDELKRDGARHDQLVSQQLFAGDSA